MTKKVEEKEVSNRKTGAWEFLFNDKEMSAIQQKVQNIDIKNVVLCSFESRFARSGGLAAVVKKLLPAISQLKKLERTLLITPFYPHIIDRKKLSSAAVNFQVTFGKQTVEVEILEYMPGQEEVIEYYLNAPGFFESQNSINDPYGYFPDDPDRNNKSLIENALFFCKAVPLALHALGIRENIVFHLQEWQTTLIALTGKEAMLNGLLESCICVQTMHNPFDSGISLTELSKILYNKKLHEKKFIEKQVRFTAYQLGIPLMDTSVTTVSEHFAGELTSDFLQTGHFARHLQVVLEAKGILGVNNGLFVDFPPDFSENRQYSLTEIKEIKSIRRKALLEILNTYRPPETFGNLTFRGKSIIRLPDDIPILVMSGRLDPFQKGFDILLMAIEKFARDEIKVIFSPLPVSDSQLKVFRETAEKCYGNVVVFPIRMEEGYQELQMGSTFGIMPSIYEPFGAAVEYMVNGTVTIARNTGGLADQIEDKVCGFLYRENPGTYTLDNIKAFALSNNELHKRKSNPWALGMADALYKTIKEASVMYQNFPDRYYRLIAEGLKKARSFTWQKAAETYYHIYKKIRDR